MRLIKYIALQQTRSAAILCLRRDARVLRDPATDWCRSLLAAFQVVSERRRSNLPPPPPPVKLAGGRCLFFVVRPTTGTIELLATGYNTFYFLVTVSKDSVLREAD